MAFQIRGSDWISSLKQNCSEQHNLFVERIDRESDSVKPLILRTPSRLKSLVPDRLKRSIKKRFLWNRTDLPFVQASQRLVGYKKFVYKDISPQHNASWRDFLMYIQEASTIVTNRLHVGILGCLLDKRVFLVDAMADYEKIQEVFSFSLQNEPMVSYISRDVFFLS
jgi:exopolysaccharide biosynthesis predicted pyruvyltransferase EpsI